MRRRVDPRTGTIYTKSNVKRLSHKINRISLWEMVEFWRAQYTGNRNIKALRRRQREEANRGWTQGQRTAYR